MDDSLVSLTENSWCLVSAHQGSLTQKILLGSATSLLGISDDEFFQNGFLQVLVRKKPSPCPWEEECESSIYMIRNGDGTIRWMESRSVRGGDKGELVVFTRSANNDEYEPVLNQARLSLAGGLLGPLAHELNNIIQGLTSAEYLMRDNLESGEPVEMEDVDQLAEGVDYLRRLGADVQNFARMGFRDCEALDLPSLISETISFLRSVGKLKTVEVSLDIPENMPDLFWHRIELHYVLCALLCNAAEAAIDGENVPAVSLRITAENETFGLWVGDSGDGFELEEYLLPFTSKKLRHRHPGVGLSTVARIVYSRNGDMSQSASETNTIHVTLPMDVVNAAKSRGADAQSTDH